MVAVRDKISNTKLRYITLQKCIVLKISKVKVKVKVRGFI